MKISLEAAPTSLGGDNYQVYLVFDTLAINEIPLMPVNANTLQEAEEFAFKILKQGIGVYRAIGKDDRELIRELTWKVEL